MIIGIRPEDIEDARLATDVPADRRLKTAVDLREALGSDVVVHFSLGVPPVVTEDTKELAEDLDRDSVAELEAAADKPVSVFIARLSAETKAKLGEPIELAVETRRMHFFAPDSGLGIY